MQRVEKKHRRKSPRRALLILAAVLVLLLSAAAWLLAQRPAQVKQVSKGYEAALIKEASSEDVAEVSTVLRLGEGWTLRQERGLVTLAEDADFTVDEAWAGYIFDAAAVIESPAVLTEEESEYAAHLADFGLDTPRAQVRIRYADGEEITLRIGDAVSAEAGSWLYMTVEGSPALYAMDKGTADLFTTDRSLLREIVQPTLHAQRFDRIALTTPESTVEWALSGAIGNSDALERWSLIRPQVYPADAGAMESLGKHIESLRLGAWVAAATEEKLAAYGLDQPRLTLTVHQAAGDMGTTNAIGEYEITAWPESTFTLAVGGAKSEDVDYVLFDGQIYIASHYALNTLMTIDWRETLTRFPVLTALGNLRRLTIEENGVLTAEYIVTRSEQVAQNNELVTDYDGSVVYDTSVTRNGESCDWAAFESAYSRLVTVLVSGVLPDTWQPCEPHTVYTFEDVDGTVHTVALAAFDALHDAVVVDGQGMFYLIKGGFALE